MNKILIVFAALFLASCASLWPKGETAPRLFTLNAPFVHNNNVTNAPHSLQVLLPEANPGIDSDRIALRRSDNGIDYFAGAKWASTLPSLLQAMFVESFDRNGQLKAVGSDLVVMKDSYQLLIEVRDFQAEYIVNSSGPRAHVRLTAKLLKSNNNSIVRTQIYDEIVPAKTNTLNDVVAALDAAYRQASERIIIDTVAALSREPKIAAKR